MINRPIATWTAAALLLTAGCTSDQLTAMACVFDNDPTMPRSPECLAVDRQQDQAAEIRRLDREIARNERRAEAERDSRNEALSQAIANLEARVAALPDPSPLFSAGDYHGAFLASDQRRLAVLEVWREFIAINIDEVEAAQESVGSSTFLFPEELRRVGAQVQGNHSWFALFDPSWNAEFEPDDRFSHAATSARWALDSDPSQRWVRTNLAHALMFQDMIEQADAIYLGGRGEIVEANQASWEDVVADDFRQLRAAGISHPHMDEVLAGLGR